MSGREPTNAAFEPTALAPRRRRADPVLLGAVIVVVGLVAAVVKPWGDGSEGEAVISPAPQASAALGAPSTGRPSGPPSPPVAEEAPPAIAWPSAAAVITPHGAWGIRAIVRDPGSGDRASDPVAGLVERWTAMPSDPDGADVALLDTADQGVLALGITFPPDELPLDVRIWRMTRDGGWEWLHAPPLGATPATGATLFAPPPIDGVPRPTWPTGSYRLQVLMGATIREIEVGLPDRFEVVPGPADRSSRSGADSPFDPEFRLDGSDRLFVVQDGVATPLDGDAAEPTDLATAWRDAGSADDESTLDIAPSVHAPRATGLGVMLPLGASEASATITALAPDTRAVDARRVIGLHFTDGGRSPYVIFRAPRAGTWPAGIYRIDAAWTLAGARQEASYHAELRPGPQVGPTVLAALRTFASRALSDVVLGASAQSATARELSCDDDDLTVIGDIPAVIGIGHPAGEPPEAIDATLLLDGGRTVVQPVLVATEPIDGLTLVVPANGETFVPGVYHVTLHAASGERVLTACVGVASLP